jgi:hypothetical protein
MKTFFLFFIISVLCFSCKKEYQCECVQERRQFVFEKTVILLNERSKKKALSECKKEYESIPGYTGTNYADAICEIK